MSDPNPQSRAPTRGGSVLDPTWERDLRRGQEAEGEAGSVDAELAYVHLLRHVRAPEVLEPAQLDAIWSEIDAELSPARQPWWRKAWVWWTAPALAAAAVMFVVVVNPDGQEEASLARSDDNQAELAQDDAKLEQAPAPAPEALAEPADGDQVAAAEARKSDARGLADAGAAEGGARSAQVSALEANFTRLAPNGRRAIRVSVDQSRDQLRSQLLDNARGGG